MTVEGLTRMSGGHSDPFSDSSSPGTSVRGQTNHAAEWGVSVSKQPYDLEGVHQSENPGYLTLLSVSSTEG